MNKCEIVKDLIPMYVDDLVTDDSKQLIEEHIRSCKKCSTYLQNIQRELGQKSLLEMDIDHDDEKLVKGLKREVNKIRIIANLFGILIGIAVSLLFFNAALVVAVLCVFLVIYAIKLGKGGAFEKRGLNIVIFVLSLISFIFSLKIFLNIAIYVDDYGASSTEIYGGEFWLYMSWLRLALLAIITFLSGMKLFSK